MPLLVPSRSHNFYSRSHSCQSVVKRCVCVYRWVSVPVIHISFGVLPVKEGHDVESSTVSRPTAAACNVTAATLQDRDYARFTPSPAGLSQRSPTPGSPETLAGILPLPFPCKILARTV